MGLVEICSPAGQPVVIADSNPRDLVFDVIKDNPQTERKEQFEKFRSMLDKRSDAYQRAVDWYFFVNMSESLKAPQRPSAGPVRHEQARERRSELVAKVKEQLLALDLVMPNGKIMRDCTGTEMAKFGNRYQRIAERVGKAKTVGSVLNEGQVQDILKG